MQGITNSRIEGNSIFNPAPIANEDCGIAEIPDSGDSGTAFQNTVNDSRCGVVFVTADAVEGGQY